MYAFTHRVHYHEVDQQGFLFNGKHLEIADVAMTEFFRSVGWTYVALNAAGVDPSVVRANVEYRSPARFDDELDVTVACTAVGRSSFELTTNLAAGERAISRITCKYVNVDAPLARSVPLPAEIAALLRRHLEVETSEGSPVGPHTTAPIVGTASVVPG